MTSFQLMTHYANDYFDLEADRANQTPTTWSGGSRVLPAGELSPRVALIAASPSRSQTLSRPCARRSQAVRAAVGLSSS